MEPNNENSFENPNEENNIKDGSVDPGQKPLEAAGKKVGDAFRGLVDTVSSVASSTAAKVKGDGEPSGFMAAGTGKQLDQLVAMVDDLSGRVDSGFEKLGTNLATSGGGSLDTATVTNLNDSVIGLQSTLLEQLDAMAIFFNEFQQQTYNNLNTIYARVESGFGAIQGGVVAAPASGAPTPAPQEVPQEEAAPAEPVAAPAPEPAPASEPVAAPAPAAPKKASGGIGNEQWASALIGALFKDPLATAYCKKLLQDVLNANNGARIFLGQLLVFRSSAPEKMPQLLRDLGEAYYMWRPMEGSTEDPFEGVIVAWVNETLKEAKIGNYVEAVQPGGRFDSQRHNSGKRSGGVEISEVLGWIVFREGGKVYVKASVDVI